MIIAAPWTASKTTRISQEQAKMYPFISCRAETLHQVNIINTDINKKCNRTLKFQIQDGFIHLKKYLPMDPDILGHPVVIHHVM